MLEFTAHEIENLVDLVENKLLAMSGSGYEDEFDFTVLKDCRSKLLVTAEAVPGVTVIPFDEEPYTSGLNLSFASQTASHDFLA